MGALVTHTNEGCVKTPLLQMYCVVPVLAVYGAEQETLHVYVFSTVDPSGHKAWFQPVGLPVGRVH